MADKKFADYVKDLMESLPKVNGNPMMSVTSMTDENARYREDPFYISRDIQERRRLAEEEAARQAAEAGLLTGRPTDGGGGYDGTELDPAIAAFLEAENMGARGRRNNEMIELLTSNTGNSSIASGMTDSMGFTTAGRLNQMAYQYNKTPDWLKSFLPQSYANAAGFINQSDSIFGGMNPYGNVNMGAQQAAMLAAQDMGLFDNPQDRAAWYSDNSGGDSGGGGWSTGGSVTDSGTGDNPNEGGYWG